MALGGGYFTAYNKVLPGSYMVFSSAQRAEIAMANRGIAAMGLELDWGPEGEIFTVTADLSPEESLELLGCGTADAALKGVRDVLRNSNTLYAYRLNGGGVKAKNSFAEAKYSGVGGNKLKIAISPNVDDETLFDVQTIMGASEVDKQTVAAATDLKANAFVDWLPDVTLTATASSPLTGGENGTVDGDSHQVMLDKLEGYYFNALGLASTDSVTKKLYVNYCKRMREDIGAKFQVVLQGEAADYEAVVNVKNVTTDKGWPEASAVYWATGAIAGCGLNESNTNKLYDGEFEIKADYTQAQLAKAIKAGEFTFHTENGEVRVLTDINSLTSLTDVKGEDFKENKVIRIIDQIATDITKIFNRKYLGKGNTERTRTAFWSDIVRHHKGMMDEDVLVDFVDEDITVQSIDKKSIAVTGAVQPAGTLEKLYYTCYIS